MVIQLEATGISFAYSPGIPVVRDVAIGLVPGQLVCVIGPNGAGKSTLLKLLAGLLEPSAGAVTLEGRPVRSLQSKERARAISVVPQSLPRVPELLVRDFVLGGRYGHSGTFGASAAHDFVVVGDALGQADAVEFVDRPLASLSGGQLQRVLIARALAQEAGILLVDEPTSSLDPEHQLGVFGLLRSLTGAGRAGLIVTHDMNLASQYAHRIYLMKEGQFVASGTPNEILRPEVLGPVYGKRLRYGSWSTREGERPFVVPWSIPE